MSWHEMEKGGGASWVCVPDSDLTWEENYWQCRVCTEKHGKLHPMQYVVGELYSGVA
jgi:hypothetical protein